MLQPCLFVGLLNHSDIFQRKRRKTKPFPLTGLVCFHVVDQNQTSISTLPHAIPTRYVLWFCVSACPQLNSFNLLQLTFPCVSALTSTFILALYFPQGALSLSPSFPLSFPICSHLLLGCKQPCESNGQTSSSCRKIPQVWLSWKILVFHLCLSLPVSGGKSAIYHFKSSRSSHLISALLSLLLPPLFAL